MRFFVSLRMTLPLVILNVVKDLFNIRRMVKRILPYVLNDRVFRHIPRFATE